MADGGWHINKVEADHIRSSAFARKVVLKGSTMEQ